MRIVSLGAASLEENGEILRLQPLPVILLAYLAVEGPKSRTHLAELFWRHSANGLNSLSTTLSRIRAKAPDAVWTRGSLMVGTNLAIDTADLREAAAAGDAVKVADLYRGPFLPNPGLRRLGSELEEWVLDTRDAVAAEAETALIRRARHDFESGDVESAADFAERAYVLKKRDGVPSPELFVGYYRILAEAQRPLASEVRREAADYGIEIEALEVEIAPPAPAMHASATAPMPRAVASQPIVGFEQELAALRAACSESRITEIIGLGGSGKTSLAAHYAFSELADEEMIWVDLSPIRDPELVESAIANAFGVTLAPGQALSEAIAVDRETLVVFDNFEQVIDGAPVLTRMVDANRFIRAIATSRIPLDIEGTAVVRLEGLSRVAAERDSPARQVLAAAAQRSGVSVAEMPGAVLDEICELVGGLPLALELAGSWARVLPPGEIARSLRETNELLDPGIADTAQRSMKVIVDESLRTLDAEQRDVVDQLAILPVGCTIGDASSSLGLSIRRIGDLVDRSILTVDRQSSRLRIHPLIAQQSLRELHADPARLEQFRMTQAAWCRSLTDLAADRAQEAAGVLSIGPELANVLAAWRSTMAANRWDLVDASLAAVREFFAVSGRLIEGQKALQQALEQARAQNPPADVWVRLLEANAWLALLTGQLGRATTLATEARDAIARSDSADEVATDTEIYALRTFGTIRFTAGDIAAAATSFEAAMALVTPLTPRTVVAKLHDDIGSCRESQGRIDDARAAFRATLEMGREIGDPLMIARGYLLLAGLEQTVNPKRCLVLLNEGLAVAREHKLDHLAIYFPLFAGQAHLARNDYSAAAEAFSEGLRDAQAVGHRTSVAAAYVGLAESVAVADPAAAKGQLIDGVRASVETACAPYLMWAAYVAGDLSLGDDPQLVAARELLAMAATAKATESTVRVRAAAACKRHGVDVTGTADGLEGLLLAEIGERVLELLLFD